MRIYKFHLLTWTVTLATGRILHWVQIILWCTWHILVSAHHTWATSYDQPPPALLWPSLGINLPEYQTMTPYMAQWVWFFIFWPSVVA